MPTISLNEAVLSGIMILIGAPESGLAEIPLLKSRLGCFLVRLNTRIEQKLSPASASQSLAWPTHGGAGTRVFYLSFRVCGPCSKPANPLSTTLSATAMDSIPPRRKQYVKALPGQRSLVSEYLNLKVQR